MAPQAEPTALRLHCAYLEDRAAIGRVAFLLAHRMGFDQRACWEIDIVVQELVSNIVRHAVSGYLELREHAEYLEVSAVDQGPGISPAVVLASATSQHGLGAIRRLMNTLEISTLPERGTRVVARRERT